MSDEIWKDVKGYEGEYQISNKGRLKSIRYIEKYSGIVEKVMKPGNNGRGYMTTMIGRNGNVKSVKIHRLVAEAFIPNPENLPEVNHIDGNKKNNCVENLEWVTHQGNMVHAYATKLNVKNSKLSRYEIQNMRERYIPKDQKYGIQAFAKRYGMSSSHITRIIHGEVCKIEHLDSSAIKDGWCVCPKCGRKLFEITKHAYIEHFWYTCDYEDCGHRFEVNTPVLDKYIDENDKLVTVELPVRGNMTISEYRELKKRLHICRDCNRVDENTVSGKVLCKKSSVRIYIKKINE